MAAETTARAAQDHTTEHDFITYPLHKLVSIFATEEKMNAAVEELKANGYADDIIESFCGFQGEKRLDFTGEDHGFWTSLLRNVQHIGPDRIYLERYEQALSEGHCMVMVDVTSQIRKERAARILHKHTDERVTYFGLLAANEIK